MAHILLIEDTEAVRGLFRTVLEQAGYVVHEASTGTEGIRLFRESPSDVVITDMYMPDGDGFDVISTLRREDPAPKIIVISGRSSKGEILSAAKLMGADLVLPKPVTMDDLLTAVKRAWQFRPLA
jgi:CheY-like chemotaxis protein